MERTIRFESKAELQLISALERGHKLLECYSQPATLVLVYRGARARKQRSSRASDHIVIRHRSAGWYDTKHRDKLPLLSQDKPSGCWFENSILDCPGNCIRKTTRCEIYRSLSILCR
jgi:hypothetical protein